MRPDMKSVIIERPRVGGGFVKKEPKPFYDKNNIEEDFDSGPRQKSLTKELGYARKEQTDVLGPLKRFLDKSIGRRWDDIWSEVCEHNKSFIGDHVKLHIDGFVWTKVTVDDGKLYGAPYFVPLGPGDMYVDPETNILTKIEGGRTRYRRPKAKKNIVEMDGQEYFKHDNIWYRVKMAPWPTYDKAKTVRLSERSVPDKFGFGDHVVGRKYLDMSAIHNRLWKAYGAAIYCTEKQQCGKKECKKLNAFVEGVSKTGKKNKKSRKANKNMAV